MKPGSYTVERNMAVGHSAEQEWRVWQTDEYGDEWTMFFAPTKSKAEKWAKRHRGRDRVHSLSVRTTRKLVREYLDLAVPTSKVRDLTSGPARFRTALERAFKAGYRSAYRTLGIPRKP